MMHSKPLVAALRRSLVAVALMGCGVSVASAQAKPDTTKKPAPAKTTAPAKTATPPVTQSKTATPPATQTKANTPPATQTKANTPPVTQSKTANPPAPQSKAANPPAGQTKSTPPSTQSKTATPPVTTPNKTAPAPNAAQPNAAQNKTAGPAAGQTKAPVTTPPAGRGATGLNVATRSDTAAAAPLVMMREVFEYDRDGRRDPFLSLLSTTDLRPVLSDLKLLMTVVDEPGRSVALLQDAYEKKQKTVRVGSRLGRMRVSSIRADVVVFTIEEFGTNRRDSLLLRDSTKVRGR